MDKICEIAPAIGCISCVPSPIKNGVFSLDFVSTPQKTSESKIGCQITALIMDANKKRTENKTEFDVIRKDDHLILGNVSDIPEKLFLAVFVVRPYVEQDGLRGYGNVQVFYYSGKTEDGLPVVSTERPVFQDCIYPSHDTYIRNMEGKIYGSEETLEIKNKGDGNSMTRYLYIKFDIPEDMVDVLLDENEINLQFFLKITRLKLSEQETKNGGILVNVFKTDTNWDEATLCYANADTVKIMEKLGELRIKGSGIVKLDITEYLHNELKKGVRSLSFRLENQESDGDDNQSIYFSKECSNLYNRPKISFCEPLFTRDFFIAKPMLDDFMYEPWGYAERVVNEWITETKDKVYATGGGDNVFELTPVDVSKPSGAHTVRTDGRNTGNPPSGVYNTLYARTIDTLISEGGYVEDPASFAEHDEYGGIINSGIKGEVTGWFHPQLIDGRTYLIDPLGNPFFMVGVSSLNEGTENQKNAVIEKYGSLDAYWESITKELKEVGVNLVSLILQVQPLFQGKFQKTS